MFITITTARYERGREEIMIVVINRVWKYIDVKRGSRRQSSLKGLRCCSLGLVRQKTRRFAVENLKNNLGVERTAVKHLGANFQILGRVSPDESGILERCFWLCPQLFKDRRLLATETKRENRYRF